MSNDIMLHKRIVEGVLFVSQEPVPIKRLKEALAGVESPEGAPAPWDQAAVQQLIESLNEEYRQSGRAFRIQEIAGGFQLVTDPDLAPWLKRALQPPKGDTVSKAALETLAIIAYRQPLTKAEVEVVRGVDGTATLETLLERGFVRVVGRKDSPGRPLLYGTTEEFLRHFGLKSLEALPPMPHAPMTIPGFPAESDSTRPIVPPAEPAGETTSPVQEPVSQAQPTS